MITHKSIGYSGRLGNQMFQYAALKAISLETGFECFLPNNLNIKPDGLFNFTNNKWIEYKLDLLDGFKLKCEITNNPLKNEYTEKSFIFDPDVFNISDNTSIDGYYQSYKYFEKYEDEIRNEFQFKSDILNKCLTKIKNYPNPVSIHIRRGDYVNHPGYWVITPEYIQKALNHFTDQEYTFLIFSDDIEWCKQIFPEGVVFIEGNNQFEDLCLMSLCDHNIISNSTFSWWGAWLNSNPNKKVIVPSNWFIPNKPLTDLYPNNWTIVNLNVNKELVISLFDKDLEWVKNINKDIKITVYRKGNKTSYPDEIFINKNVGRDVHTFFYHIVTNYNNLSDYTFFSQDYPFDHIENYIDIINGTHLEWNMYSSYKKDEYWGYHWNSIGTMWLMDDSIELGSKVLKCNKFGKPHHREEDLPIESIWNNLFLSPCPEILEFTPGGHFSISKEQILSRDLEFYKKILTLLENNELSPWVIERLEPYIFNKHIN